MAIERGYVSQVTCLSSGGCLNVQEAESGGVASVDPTVEFGVLHHLLTPHPQVLRVCERALVLFLEETRNDTEG